MSFTRYFLLFMCIIVCDATLVAQGRIAGSISGSVVSSQTKKPIEMVNVAIVNASTGAIVTGSVTDAKGKFTIADVPAGNYRAKASILGYHAELSKVFVLDAAHTDVRLAVFALAESEVNLNEVTITGTKTALNTAIDRKVYNVQQDIMSQSGTASDLLQNIPSVQVDIDGNVSLRGSTDVMILINGKKSPLMGANRADVLAQMQASSIERIEVITNPSAKYKPDGTSGIINIVMKKNAGTGLNGTLIGNAGNQSRYNGSASLTYNPGTFNIFGSVSYRQDDRTSLTTDTRTQRDGLTAVTGYFNDNARSTSRPSSEVITLGGEATIDAANAAGLSGNYHHRGFTRTDVSDKVQRDAAFVITERYERVRYDPEYENEIGMDAYVQHAFAGEDHKLRLEFKASHKPEVEDNHYTNLYTLPGALVNYDNTLIKQTEDQNEAAAEYSYKIDDKNTFEAGYAGEFNKRDMEYLGSFFDPMRSQFITDTIKTNHFLYNETIHALYATYETGAGAFRLLGGLRAEQASMKADLVSKDSIVTNDYVYLYPTLHLGYKFSEAVELQLNYSRRARRPEGDDLNPFPEYQDPRNVRAGNPLLRPELIHSVEFGCQLQNDNVTVVPSLFYRNAYDRFTSVTTALNDTTLLSTMKNLSSEQSAGFELVAAGNIAKIVTANFSLMSFYEEIDASNLGFSAKQSTWTWNGSLNCNVTLPFAMMVQVNSNYRSARLTPQGQTRPTFVMNLGLRQDLLDDQLSVVLTVSDLLKTLDRRNEVNAPWLSQLTVNNRDAQIIYLGIAYHFGQPTKKQKEKSLQYDNQL
jgi:outer membrane receptor protein involved in Fe transport